MTITTKEIQDAIGKRAQLTIDKLTFEVRIIDTKSAYGQVRCLVSPESGSGSQWVSVDRIVIQE